jgi:RNA polymerase sigma-70 factor, ECF subfamily
MILLDDQDRSLWDETQIVEAQQLLERALALQGAGAYVVQAAIADLHVLEPRDWEQIVLLYRRLEQLTGSPIVTVNRAIALAEIEGPAAALALLDDLDLDGYLYFHSTRADFLRRLNRDDEAQAAYARALQLAETEPERRFLQTRLTDLTPPAAGD